MRQNWRGLSPRKSACRDPGQPADTRLTTGASRQPVTRERTVVPAARNVASRCGLRRTVLAGAIDSRKTMPGAVIRTTTRWPRTRSSVKSGPWRASPHLRPARRLAGASRGPTSRAAAAVRLQAHSGGVEDAPAGTPIFPTHPARRAPTSRRRLSRQASGHKAHHRLAPICRKPPIPARPSKMGLENKSPESTLIRVISSLTGVEPASRP